MVVPHGDPDYYGARGSIAIARPARGAARHHRRPRRLLRPAPLAGAAQAPVGRPPPRGGPRVRLARHHPLALRRPGLHGVGDARREEHAGRVARARARRDAGPGAGLALPRRLARGRAAAHPAGRRGRGRDEQRGRLRREGRRGRGHGGRPGRAAGLRVALREGGARSPLRHRARDLRGGQDAEGRRAPAPVARQRRGVPARPLRRQPPADRPAHPRRRGPRGGLRGRGRLGHPRGAGQRARPARGAAARVRRGARRARSRPGRPHERRGGAHDVGVRPHRARERQPRHRSRARHRDARARGRGEGRPGLRALAGTRGASSSSRAATWP